ncbi:MAG: hypothetical protein ACXWYS_03525 [Gaiellaceae bacterium]
MARKILVVTTTSPDPDRLKQAVADGSDDAVEFRVVAPATKIGKLDWLTNDEDDARARAARAADETAAALADTGRVAVDRTSHNTDPASDIDDALRNFDADEIVLVTSAGGSEWLEDETVRAAIEASGLPVRQVELPPPG